VLPFPPPKTKTKTEQMTLLSLQKLTKDFGALRVLEDVTLELDRGSLHAVVGPNGAGKTTLFNLISGFIKPTAGKIVFDGIDISKIPPHQIAHLGIGRSFQVLTFFPELTVLENVRLAVQATSKKRFSLLRKAMDMRDIVERSYEILSLFGLGEKAGVKASELSHGEQRYLDIGIAMAGGAKLLLLDEPTSGLVYDEIPRMGETIRKLTPNITVLLIEHRIEMVLSISHIITVLDYGRIIAQGPPGIVRRNEEISKAYLGLR
jgi:branched-chain amino acid transport system ATP-binding protein